MASTASASYTRTAIALHWLIALVILSMMASGWSFDLFADESAKFALIRLHKSLGITILLLTLFRLFWRLTHHAPPLPATLPAWEIKSARIAHILIYVASLGLPLSGWAMVSASPRNIPTVLFGLIPWPQVPLLQTLGHKKEIAERLGDLHGIGAALLALLIAGHAAAALRHHFILRNDILASMAPRHCAGFLNRLRGHA